MSGSRSVVHLRPFGEDDIPRLLAWVGTEEVALVQWAGPQFRAPLDAAQLRDHVRHAERDRRRIFVAEDPSGAAVGHAEFSQIDRANGTARISRILIGEPSRRGEGLGEALVRELVRFASGELGLRELSLGVYDFNLAAIRCYERVGFRALPDGLERAAVTVQGEDWSSQRMVLCLAEFEG